MSMSYIVIKCNVFAEINYLELLNLLLKLSTQGLFILNLA